MRAAEQKTQVPVWLLGGIIAVVVLLVGMFVWGGLSHGSAPGVKDKEVHAGMYDFRKEAQSGNLGRRPPQ